jgi:Putative porin
MHTHKTRMRCCISVLGIAIFLMLGLTGLAEDAPKPYAKPTTITMKAKTAAEHPKPQAKKAPAASSAKAKTAPAVKSDPSHEDAIALLKQQLAEQQKEIKMLQSALAEQKILIESAIESNQSAAAQPADSSRPDAGVVASLTPVIPMRANNSAPSTAVPTSLSISGSADPGAAPASAAQVEEYTKKVDAMGKTVDALNKGLAGFKLSGDVRLRSDNTFRSSNSVAGPAQNVRVRYRARLNVDKELGDKVATHIQLGTGALNNPLTLDTDFAGNNTRGLVMLTEAWGDFHPNSMLSLRGGKMSEIFADGEQFIFDDDVRFNGFQEIIRGSQPKSNFNVEFRAGQYIISNPNVQILPSAASCAGASPSASCAYLTAGYQPGRKVPSTNMFDQGIFISGKAGEFWSHQFTADIELWRNPNSMQLAANSNGFPVLVNGYYGIDLSGGVGGSGNGTTVKGGAIYTASAFHVGKIGYRVDYRGWKTSHQAWPLYLTVQAARNFGASFYENALEGAVAVGETKKFGEVALKYAYYYKEANSMISQITDDDVGTGTGVNNRVHAFRVEFGLNKYMVWQNRIYIMNALASSDPARNFFVPYQKGANTQYRYQSQLQFTF